MYAQVPRWATQTPIRVGALLFQAIDKAAYIMAMVNCNHSVNAFA